MFAVANWNDRENWLFDTMCVIDDTVYMRWMERERNCMSGRRCTTFSTHLYCGCRNFSVQPNWSSNCQNAFSELNTVWRMERALRMTVQQHGETSKQHFIENIDLCVQTSIFTWAFIFDFLKLRMVWWVAFRDKIETKCRHTRKHLIIGSLRVLHEMQHGRGHIGIFKLLRCPSTIQANGYFWQEGVSFGWKIKFFWTFFEKFSHKSSEILEERY